LENDTLFTVERNAYKHTEVDDNPSAHACVAETTLRAVWVVCQTRFCLAVETAS